MGIGLYLVKDTRVKGVRLSGHGLETVTVEDVLAVIKK